jgi:hypothetical protein
VGRSDFLEAIIDTAGSGDNTLIAGVTGYYIAVYKIWYVLAGDVNHTLKNGSTAFSGTVTGKAGGSFVLDYDGTPWFVTTAGNGFVLNLSGAVQVSGRVYYHLAKP